MSEKEFRLAFRFVRPFFFFFLILKRLFRATDLSQGNPGILGSVWTCIDFSVEQPHLPCCSSWLAGLLLLSTSMIFYSLTLWRLWLYSREEGVGTSTRGFGIESLRFKSGCCHFQIVWLWASCLTTPCLPVLTWKVGWCLSAGAVTRLKGDTYIHSFSVQNPSFPLPGLVFRPFLFNFQLFECPFALHSDQTELP